MNLVWMSDPIHRSSPLPISGQTKISKVLLGTLRQGEEAALSDEVKYKTALENVDWQEMKSTLAAEHFDNGRTPKQLRESFKSSYATVIAYTNERIIGTARVLSDGVCNAYIVDVWTLTTYRRRGIARTMMKMLLAQLEGQHVYLFTDE